MTALRAVRSTRTIGVAVVNVAIRKALGSDAGELTAITFAAKRHWGYPEEWIDLWRDELTVSSQYVEKNWVFVATNGSRILGWCAVSEDKDEYWLDYCWVLPEVARLGIGRQLVLRATRLAAEMRSVSLKVMADPNAEGFYSQLGFRRIGDHPSLPHGRRLPLMEAVVLSDA